MTACRGIYAARLLRSRFLQAQTNLSVGQFWQKGAGLAAFVIGYRQHTGGEPCWLAPLDC